MAHVLQGKQGDAPKYAGPTFSPSRFWNGDFPNPQAYFDFCYLVRKTMNAPEPNLIFTVIPGDDATVKEAINGTEQSAAYVGKYGRLVSGLTLDGRSAVDVYPPSADVLSAGTAADAFYAALKAWKHPGGQIPAPHHGSGHGQAA